MSEGRRAFNYETDRDIDRWLDGSERLRFKISAERKSQHRAAIHAALKDVIGITFHQRGYRAGSITIRINRKAVTGRHDWAYQREEVTKFIKAALPEIDSVWDVNDGPFYDDGVEDSQRSKQFPTILIRVRFKVDQTPIVLTVDNITERYGQELAREVDLLYQRRRPHTERRGHPLGKQLTAKLSMRQCFEHIEGELYTQFETSVELHMSARLAIAKIVRARYHARRRDEEEAAARLYYRLEQDEDRWWAALYRPRDGKMHYSWKEMFVLEELTFDNPIAAMGTIRQWEKKGALQIIETGMDRDAKLHLMDEFIDAALSELMKLMIENAVLDETARFDG